MSSIRKGYSSIAELPSQVIASFSERDQRKWMDAYNEEIGDSSDPNDVKRARKHAWESMIGCPSGMSVEAWGSVEIKDSDGEIVNIDKLAEHNDIFIEHGGPMMDSHSNCPVASVWDWEERIDPETGQKGLVYRFNVFRDTDTTDRIRQEIEAGYKRSLSIGADAPRGEYKCDERGCYTERNVSDLYEISIVENPACPSARFIAINGDSIEKSRKEGGITIKCKGVRPLGNDERCPVRYTHAVLAKRGIQGHILANNHILASCTRERLLKALDVSVSECKFKEVSPGTYEIKMTRNTRIMKEEDPMDLDTAIETAIGNGWAYRSNNKVLLQKECPEDFFKEQYERGHLQCVSNYWSFRDTEKLGGLSKNVLPRCPNGYRCDSDGYCKDADGNPPAKAGPWVYRRQVPRTQGTVTSGNA